MPVTRQLLSSDDSANRLGICVSTLYDWLAQSDAGKFEIRAQQVTIDYYQGGRRGQGRIKIDVREIDRLLSLMRAAPTDLRPGKTPKPKTALRHITASLGRPDD